MTESRDRNLLWVLPCSLLLLCFSAHGDAQELPHLAQLEWRNVVIQEQAASFDSALKLNQPREAASQAQKLIDGDLEPSANAGDAANDWPIWHLIPDENVEGLYHSPSYHFARRLVGGRPDTLASYREIFGARAQQALDRARFVGSFQDLVYISRRFAATEAGFRCKEMVGFQALEAGHGPLATRLFADLLDLDWQGEAHTRLWRSSALVLAHRLNGDRSSMQRIGKQIPADSKILVGGISRDFDEFCSNLALQEGGLDLKPSGLARQPGRSAPLDPTGELTLKWSQPLGGKRPRVDQVMVSPLVVQAENASQRVVYHDRHHAFAFDLATGKELWSLALDDSGAGKPSLRKSDEFFRDMRGGEADGIYVLVRGLEDESSDKAAREIVAIRCQDGAVIWRHGSWDLGPSIPNVLFDSAPLIVDGVVYLSATLGQDDVASYVFALNLLDGKILWATKIGTGVSLEYRTETGDETHPRRWMGSLPLTMAEGLLICCDNLGHIAALEPDSGRPRFLMTYKRRKITSTGHQSRNSLTRGWDQNPILVHGDRFLVAADDSDELQAYFVRPPQDADRRLANLNFLSAASLPRQRFTQLLGFDGENAVLAGREPLDELSIVHRTPVFISKNPKAGWTFPTATNLLGRGYFGQKKVYFSTHKYVYGIDMESGRDSDPIVSRESNGRNLLGHVTLVPGGMIVASKSAVQRYGSSE